MDRDVINLAIAEFVGDTGFFPQEECPSGHAHGYGDGDAGSLCQACVYDGTVNGLGDNIDKSMTMIMVDRFRHEDDRSWHPEWRIGRGKPKDFCSSLDLLIPAVNSWCAQQAKNRKDYTYEISLLASASVSRSIAKFNLIDASGDRVNKETVGETCGKMSEALASAFSMMLM